jgi:hypothetical protein
MTQAEVPQPISGVPLRWGGFTGRQLTWLGVAAALPYLLLRWQVPLELVLVATAPWLAAGITFAFGRCEGRRLDAWVGDWVLFRAQPHHLRHPGSPPCPTYVVVDSAAVVTRLEGSPTSDPLPWVTS